MPPHPPDHAILARCSRCEAQLSDGAERCDYCGALVKRQAASAAERDRRLMENPWVMLILVLHLGVLGIPLYWRAKYSPAQRWLVIAGSIAWTLFVVVVCWIMLRWLWSLMAGT